MDRNKQLFDNAVKRIENNPRLSSIHKEEVWRLLRQCDPKDVKPGIAAAFKYVKLVTSPNYGKATGRLNRAIPRFANPV